MGFGSEGDGGGAEEGWWPGQLGREGRRVRCLEASMWLISAGECSSFGLTGARCSAYVCACVHAEAGLLLPVCSVRTRVRVRPY